MLARGGDRLDRLHHTSQRSKRQSIILIARHRQVAYKASATTAAATAPIRPVSTRPAAALGRMLGVVAVVEGTTPPVETGAVVVVLLAVQAGVSTVVRGATSVVVVVGSGAGSDEVVTGSGSGVSTLLAAVVLRRGQSVKVGLQRVRVRVRVWVEVMVVVVLDESWATARAAKRATEVKRMTAVL